jgi:predicted RNA-binding Zn ribbon-like protein
VTAPSFQPGGRAPAPAPLDLVQDFVNTEIPEWACDDIATPAELAGWLVGHGLLAEGATVDAEVFLRARALRSFFRALALANTTGASPPPDSWRTISEDLGSLRYRFELGAAGEPCLAPADAGADGALAALVSITLRATGDGTWSRVKACRKASCGWVFYDHSRNRSSNWCSMTICGNREKTAGYRRRRAAS